MIMQSNKSPYKPQIFVELLLLRYKMSFFLLKIRNKNIFEINFAWEDTERSLME
jgi:hypothetical protein